jgi:hypothetical protein
VSIRTAVEKSLLVGAGVVVGTILTLAGRAHAGAQSVIPTTLPSYNATPNVFFMKFTNSVLVDCGDGTGSIRGTAVLAMDATMGQQRLTCNKRQ